MIGLCLLDIEEKIDLRDEGLGDVWDSQDTQKCTIF